MCRIIGYVFTVYSILILMGMVIACDERGRMWKEGVEMMVGGVWDVEKHGWSRVATNTA